MEPLRHPRRADPDDARVPLLRPEDDGPRKLGPFLHHPHRVLDDPFLHRLTLAVQTVQNTRERRRLRLVLLQQKLEARPCRPNPSPRVDPGAEIEAHDAGSDRPLVAPSRFHERPHAEPVS